MTDIEIINTVAECKTMHEAAKKLNIPFSSFVRKTKKLGIYKPNQGGKGTTKISPCSKIDLKDILSGKYPNYQTYKLKVRLFKEGIFKDECSLCGWDKKAEGQVFTPCELDHIDGNPKNHNLSNLRILCPNCHSLTKTYRFRRGKHTKI